MSRLLLYLWYELAFWAFFVVLTFGSSLRVRGRQNIPRRGPVLLIANHESFFDPMLVGLACPRHPTYLARKTLFASRLLGWLIGSVGAVPIDQQGIGKEGLQTVLRRLEEGRAVIVFPEGHRTRDGALHALLPGIRLLIKRAQVPLVPIGIAGAYAAWPHGQKLPNPAPLPLPANPGAIGVWVGAAIDGRRWAGVPREKVLEELFQELVKVQEAAERLRRK